MSLKLRSFPVNGAWIANTNLDRDARTQLGADLVNGDASLDHLTPRQAAMITGIAEREIRTAAVQSLRLRGP